jgi:hypothetical protein
LERHILMTTPSPEGSMFRAFAGNPNARRLLQGLLFFIALLLLGVGLARGEADVVLRKAIRVCLECIGIG